MRLSDYLHPNEVTNLVRRALTEDIGDGDATSESLIPSAAMIHAAIVSRETCVIAGVDLACESFKQLSADITIERLVADGDTVQADTPIISVQGHARSILTAERVALNFMQRLSGIATQTKRFVEAVSSSHTTILDTRKTTPTLRALEKYAVLCGGGSNHRMGLYDRVMIKDNHREFLATDQNLTLKEMVRIAREKNPDIPIEVEVETVADFESVLDSQPDWILLDNMTLADISECVDMRHGTVKLEASGGIDLDSVKEYAGTGVDAISLGCLTHTIHSVDLSLDYQISRTGALDEH